MEDETSGKGATLILGRPFLMTARTKIDVHVRTLSMEFGDTLLQFNIFEAMKHPTEDHSLLGIDLIDELLSLSQTIKARTVFHLTRTISIKRSRPQQPKVEIMSAHLVSSSTLVGQLDPKASNANSSLPPPPMELKPLPSNLKYAYLDAEQQLPFIIANNLHREQEDKLLQVLREHKKAIRWKLSDLPGINPSICMHRILMEEEAKPIRQH
ncbi:hypothetical protein CR513_34125, partial [Mucuna pruriens]